MAVIKVHRENNFTVMSNIPLRDKRLSLKSLGLLCKVFSLPPNWDYSIGGLTAICKESHTTIETALNELKRLGYLVVVKKFPDETESGRIEYEYNFYEIPEVEKQDQEMQGLEKQDPGNQETYINKDNKEKINKKQTTKENNKNKKGRRFKKPTVDEIRTYCLERKNSVDAEQFFDYYEAKGWLVGKSPMKDWKAAVRTWERNGFSTNQVARSGMGNTVEVVADPDVEEMFGIWKQYLGITLKRTQQQVDACKDLLDDIGKDGITRLIVALRMRSQTNFVTREVKSVKDFVTLSENRGIMVSFYEEHEKAWQRQQEAARRGKKPWEI